MAVVPTIEGLCGSLEEFAALIDKMEADIASWQQDDRIRPGLLAADSWQSEFPSLTIIVSAESVSSVVELFGAIHSYNIEDFLERRRVKDVLEWIQVFRDHGEADCSPVEHQLQVVMRVLGVARNRARRFTNEQALLPVAMLGLQSLLDLQNYVTFNLKQMEDGFVMLRAKLVHGLVFPLEEIEVALARIEEQISEIRSKLVATTERFQQASEPLTNTGE